MPPRRAATRLTLERLLEVKVSYDRDHERAVAECGFWAPLALPAEAKQGVHDPIELERLAAGPDVHAESRFIVSGDPDEAADRIGAYVDMGFRHLIFHSPAPDQERFLKLFGAKYSRCYASAGRENGARHRYSRGGAEHALGATYHLTRRSPGSELAEQLALVLDGELVGVDAVIVVLTPLGRGLGSRRSASLSSSEVISMVQRGSR